MTRLDAEDPLVWNYRLGSSLELPPEYQSRTTEPGSGDSSPVRHLGDLGLARRGSIVDVFEPFDQIIHSRDEIVADLAPSRLRKVRWIAHRPALAVDALADRNDS